MATHIKIQTPENTYIHVDTHKNNYTLCGLETGNDSGLAIKTLGVTNRRINCPTCIDIIQFCKKIKASEIKKGE